MFPRFLFDKQQTDMMTQGKHAKFWLSVLIVALTLPLCAKGNESLAPETTIWFDAPAKNFAESSPMAKGLDPTAALATASMDAIRCWETFICHSRATPMRPLGIIAVN